MDKYLNVCNYILLLAEFIAAIIGLFYLRRLKGSPWRFFVYYLLLIFLQELYFKYNEDVFQIKKQTYYAYIGIPIQYALMFWLFAYYSLKKKWLFYICTALYIATIPIQIQLEEIEVVLSINYTVGTLILFGMIVLEFYDQIKSDEILNFKENRMFYITIGVTLSYIGAGPFFSFYNELRIHYFGIWEVYYFYFIISSCIMYLLFALSFIWGKKHS